MFEIIQNGGAKRGELYSSVFISVCLKLYLISLFRFFNYIATDSILKKNATRLMVNWSDDNEMS